MTLIFLVTSIIILSPALYYFVLALNRAIRSFSESSREIFESEAEKLLLSNIKVPVSIIIPPIEKYEVLKKIIEATLEINHPMFQVVVALKKRYPNLNKLISDFNLVKLDAVYRMVLKSAVVESSFISIRNKRLTIIVVDSDDFASVINTAIDVSLYPFICIISEEYIPSKDLLLLLEPPVISNEVPNFGSICSTVSYEGVKSSHFYIKNIYSYSNLFSLSIPSDYAVLFKKKFILDKKGMEKGELLSTFIRRLIKEGLILKFVGETGLSAHNEKVFLKFLVSHLKKIICEHRLSSLTVLVNDVYYLSFILLNAVLFYNIFFNTGGITQILIPILIIFAIIPLKDITLILNESFVRKKVDNSQIMKAILISIFKQFGIEQVISVIFIALSIKRFITPGRVR